MRLVSAMIAITGVLVLCGCERKFDEKFEENLEELTSEAGEIKAQTDERLNAGREAEKAIDEAAEAPR